MTYVTTALFAPGQMVRHKLHGYRGLIYDVDAQFDQKTTWLEDLDLVQPTENMPWYHILIDGENHAGYVAEENIEAATHIDTIEEFNHPLLSSFFEMPRKGALCARRELN